MLLLLGTLLAAVAGVILQNKGVLPFDLPTFLFFSFVLFLFALYRLGWVFLLFVGVLPLESINLAPATFGGMMLRPYQWVAVILLLAVVLRFALKQLPFRLFRPQWFDLLPLLLGLGAFVAILEAPLQSGALKQAFVVASFVLIYVLGRIFLRTLHDVRQTLPFFIVSSLVVCGYALWQNVRFLTGQTSFQVMAGRPNGTFGEADWLGMFVLLALAVGLILLFRWILHWLGRSKDAASTGLFLGIEAYLILVWVTLIITVARSAWLGALALVGIFVLGLLFWQKGPLLRGALRRTALFVFALLMSFLVAIGAVSFFQLSPFQFLNRIESTGSGLQRITVSCDSRDTLLPEKIGGLAELEQYGCRHIRLEDRVTEEQAGHFVTEVFRADPNVSIRRQIYSQVLELLKAYPLFGIGWGSAAVFLGTDGQGTGLNASNVFFEVWLGSGLLGFLAFVFWWGILAFGAFRQYRGAAGEDERLLGLFLLSLWSGLTVFDLFNSGILLGFFFLFLALGMLTLEKK